MSFLSDLEEFVEIFRTMLFGGNNYNVSISHEYSVIYQLDITIIMMVKTIDVNQVYVVDHLGSESVLSIGINYVRVNK